MASSYVFPSAFSDQTASSFQLVDRSSTSPSGVQSAPPLPQRQRAVQDGGLASLICHVAHLERSLERGSTTRFFAGSEIKVGKRTPLGSGASFEVERAEVQETTTTAAASKPGMSKSWVAIKTVKESDRAGASWTDVLLEIRSLLHEPLRYHPNIVRLLDIGWASISGVHSAFPSLILEYAEHGTLDHLQLNNGPLPFSVKQKLCYDVGRGLSILHACGVVHGDLKHENVLIFRNPYDRPSKQPYSAKLADFGGAVMDTNRQATHRLRAGTYPFEAPEIESNLTADGIRRTDTYSFGMLVWRCIIDCRDILASIGVPRPERGMPSDGDKRRLQTMKNSDAILEKAIANVSIYFITLDLPIESLHMVIYVLAATLQANPAHRFLDRAQARLRGMNTETVHSYVQAKNEANERHLESNRNRVPGRHGIDLESVGYALGRMGDDFDVQNNLPGYRPDLPHPEFGGFLFEPLKLRKVLSWSQQHTMVEEFHFAAVATYEENSPNLEPWAAAFFLFQCYLLGFGVAQDFSQACYWLHQCAQTKEDPGTVEYFAQAWLTRVCKALAIPNPLSLEAQLEQLFEGVLRGHRHCFADGMALVELLPTAARKAHWRERLKLGTQGYRVLTGGTGMPHFAHRKLRRQWEFDDLIVLDCQMREVLGDDYEASLRDLDSLHERLVVPDNGFLFDKIFVNHVGHGLLHLAATYGKVGALDHLIRTYYHNINLDNQSHSDTPLVSACRAGQYDCALILLENGADPNGSEYGQETPLHCLAHFDEAHQPLIARTLLDRGAQLEKCSGTMRKDVRAINADWEDLLGTAVTPLGRAVMMNSLTAVRALLALGASPTARSPIEEAGKVSAVELAAILTLPHILEVLLQYMSARRIEPDFQLFDECEMLEVAPSLLHSDPLTLQSRLVRCGTNYQEWMKRTLRILHERRRSERGSSEACCGQAPGYQLCRQVELGNDDIVISLLELGAPPNGSPGYRPLEQAIVTNKLELLLCLREYGALIDTIGTDDTRRSVVQLFADRSRRSPPDTILAEILIAEGAPLDLESIQPSALAFAISHNDFDLANILVYAGAANTINQPFTWPGEEEVSISLTGRLLTAQTLLSAQAIDYIANQHKSATSSLKVEPLVQNGRGLSILHNLASLPVDEVNHRLQVTLQMAEAVVSMFPDPESLGTYAVDKHLGTPLTAAVLSENTTILAVLLRSAHRQDLERSIPVPGVEAGAVASTYTPLSLALQMCRSRINEVENDEKLTNDKMEKLDRIMQICKNLYASETMETGHVQSSMASLSLHGTQSAEAPPSLSDLETHYHNVLERFNGLRQRQSGDDKPLSRDAEAEFPVDLAVLSEEKPSGWREGDDMTAEQSLRVFLKSFRSSESIGYSVEVSMDARFNRRERES